MVFWGKWKLRVKGYNESDLMSDIDGRESASEKMYMQYRFDKLEEFQIIDHCKF